MDMTTVVHEYLHTLGAGHPGHKKTDLMYEFRDGGTDIDLIEVDKLETNK
jgi:hypothetical protein